MSTPELDVVTGAFGYTGKYITRRLLSLGKSVRTLTGHPDRYNPFGPQVTVVPFNFDNPRQLIESLEGATTFYNTYWVRFPHGQLTFDKAVENSRKLIAAAREAGIRRIVHVSIVNASEESTLPYFRGKGLVEKAIIHSSLSYAIIRPTVIFGTEDILINNIAWILRRSPILTVPGSGRYRLQPVFVEDVAEMAVGAGQQKDNVTMDAAGPDTYTFDELLRLIAEKVRSRARIVHVRPGLALFFCRLIGYVAKDVVLTRDEVQGLMSDLLISKGSPGGRTRLGDWLDRNAERAGTRYASELDQHYRPT